MSIFNKLVVITPLLLLGAQSNAHICFDNPTFEGQKVCYTTDAERDLVAREYFARLIKIITSPGELVRPRGEMATMYTIEEFQQSVTRYYSHITPDSIEQIVTQGTISAVFLRSGEVLYFDHSLSAFVFDFDPPLVFAGARKFLMKGGRVTVQNISAAGSNCNLQKDGVVFLSPNKVSFFYNKGTTFCTYAGLYFENINSKITVRPVSTIGEKGFSISGDTIEFVKFLKWLQKP